MGMSPWRRDLSRRMRRPVWMGSHSVSPAFLTLAVALLVSASLIMLLEARLRPVVAEIASAQARNTMTAVVEEAVTADLAARQVGYSDFITIQRDEGGAITALTTDMARMNLLRAELTAAILEALEKADVSDIQVPLGSLFDLEPLWAKGPALKTRAMTVGTVRAEFDSQFTSAGVNQTLHRIWMEVTVPMKLLLPGGEVETELHTRLCVAETVIVGRVPDTYLQLGQQ
ncbi:MAG: sporulation protein YunB [Lawsonibacter sp.]|nr:sporulation protein YunB [Lawsonibacter sp.]